MNRDLRAHAKESGVFLWQVAAELGISEPTLYRWLRHSMVSETRDAFMRAIDKIAKEANNAE